ncbi:ATP-binding cassette domain-containing protein [Sulfobacillus sp. DSM 109850]|uniref:ATP-binding cassette domain-containing protein n=1 Tax=Sulfobacillus harzensis TaxID=2729629 RepID=A0A7Y0L7M0_9FIRM|nr:ATP-binding cassette domain-containing protein [Sulfobacillus harzensis]
MLAATGLAKTFQSKRRRVQAVNNIALEAAKGTVVGLLGPNGAGKTTTMRMLTTLLPIDSGDVRIAGYDVRREPARVRTRIGYVSQAGGADDTLTARENLQLQARLYGVSARDAADRAGRLIQQLELGDYADRAVKTYSGGQRRRLEVAMGIIHDPAVLFLDEPSTGLDPQSRAHLWEHIRRLAQAGMTVVLTTHYLDEADALCQRVYIIDHGEVVIEGDPAQLKRQVAGEAILWSWPTDDAAQLALSVLTQDPAVRDVVRENTTVRVYVDNGAAVLADLLHRLEAAGVRPATVQLNQPSLDDVFFRTTGRSLRDQTVPGEVSP